MANYSEKQLRAMSPKEFRSIVRKSEWTAVSSGACPGYAQANVVILPKEYAFEFLLFCNRNPQPCPILDVTEAGDPHPKLMAPEANLRTDVAKYRVYKDGEIVDEPTDIIKYWRNDLVGFLLGCSRSFAWALEAANIRYRHYSAYRSNVPCNPAGCFHGPMVVTIRAFYNSHDAVRAIQISSRHLLMHGPPVHIGDPVAIGIKDLSKPAPLFSSATATEPPKPGEVVMSWGCGVTPETVAMESEVSLMITHSPGHMFMPDKQVEELAIL